MRYRSRVAGMWLGVGLGLILVAAPALAQAVPYLIEVESYNPTPVVDEQTSIVISLYDVTDPTRRLEDQDLIDPKPLELRHIDSGWIIRPRFERLDDVSFHASLAYQRLGDWVVTVHPDYTERGVIPHQGDFPLELTVEVTPPPPSTSSGDWEGVLAALAFVGLLLLIAVGVGRSRWRRGTPAAPDNPGDTWWSGG